MAATWMNEERLTPAEIYAALDPEHPVPLHVQYPDLSPVYADHGPLTWFWERLRRAVTPGWV